jgi:hypothetical protein
MQVHINNSGLAADLKNDTAPCVTGSAMLVKVANRSLIFDALPWYVNSFNFALLMQTFCNFA